MAILGKSSLSGSGGSHDALIGAGVGAGLAVLGMVGRKLAVQAPSALAGSWEKALAAEHKAALLLFDKLRDTGSRNHAKRRLLLMQLQHALGKHAMEEENAVYPALRDAGFTEEADALNHDHGYVKQYLYDLSGLENGDFQAKLAAFRDEIEAHMRKEEKEIFPRLAHVLGEKANQRLTRRMNQEGLKLA